MTVLLDWLLWGFGLSVDKPSLSTELNEQLYRAVNLGSLLLQPYDYFGAWLADQQGKWNPNAFYPTPHHVVELMVQMNFAGVDRQQARFMTVNDCCMDPVACCCTVRTGRLASREQTSMPRFCKRSR
jgi:hypothetical protein